MAPVASLSTLNNLFLFTWPRYHSRIRIQGCLQLPPQGRRFQKSTQQLAYSSVGLHRPGVKWKDGILEQVQPNFIPADQIPVYVMDNLRHSLKAYQLPKSTSSRQNDTSWAMGRFFKIISICHHKTVGSPIGRKGFQLIELKLIRIIKV